MLILQGFNPTILQIIGWTILHAAWQCLLLWALFKVITQLGTSLLPGTRYLIGLATLTAIALTTIVTVLYAYRHYEIDDFTAAADPGTILRRNPVLLFQQSLDSRPIEHPFDSLISLLTVLAPLIAVAWLIGFTIHLIRLFSSADKLVALRHLPASRMPAVEARFEDLRKSMGVSKNVRLLISGSVIHPSTFGWWRTIVILPLHVAGNTPLDQVDMIISHELAHIRRRDYLVNYLQSFLEAAYWFIPLVKSISTMVREERECCCDDDAAEVCGDRPLMATALVNLSVLPKRLSLAMSATPVQHTFYHRIKRLMDPDYRPPRGQAK